MKKVLIIGATSAIAQATAKYFAHAGAALFLVARNEHKLQAVANDLTVRGAQHIGWFLADLNDFENHKLILEKAIAELQGLDIVLIAHGTLGDQAACEKDYRLAEIELKTNFLSAVSMLTELASYFESQKQGTIAVISSVAGDRGRQSNYIYGTAKSALNTFLQGLRNRLAHSGVSVITIKPGFTDTPMTASMPKNALFVLPGAVAKDIVRAIEKRKDVVYSPWFWRPIMFIIRRIPESLFKRLKL